MKKLREQKESLFLQGLPGFVTSVTEVLHNLNGIHFGFSRHTPSQLKVNLDNNDNTVTSYWTNNPTTNQKGIVK